VIIFAVFRAFAEDYGRSVWRQHLYILLLRGENNWKQTSAAKKIYEGNLSSMGFSHYINIYL